MKRLFVGTLLLVLFGAGCSLNPASTPIASYDDCVARGFPANDALGQCRANQVIYYKYGQATNPTPASTTTQW